MNGLTTWLNGLSRKAMVFIGTVVVLVLIPASLLLTWLIWGTGAIQSQLPTKQDVSDVTAAVRVLHEDEMRGLAEFAAQERSERDSARYAALFDTVSTTLIEPGIARLRSLEAQVDHLNEVMGTSQHLLHEQVDVAKDTRSRMSLMQQQMNGSTTEETQAELIRLMGEMNDRMERIEKTPQRTSRFSEPSRKQ